MFPSINSIRYSRTSDIWGEIHKQPGSGGYQRGISAWCPALCSRFCGDPLVTQRNFFSRTGVTMPSEAAVVFESESSGQVIGDPKTFFGKALDQRRVVNDTSKKWYALGAEQPSCGESSSQNGVRISTIGEEGQVDFVLVVAPSRKFACSSQHHSSPGKDKEECLGAQLNCRASLRFQVQLQVPENVLWSNIPLLVLRWHLSLPVEKLREVGEIKKLRLSYKAGYRNGNYFVCASVTAASPCILLLFYHLHYETVFPLLHCIHYLYLYIYIYIYIYIYMHIYIYKKNIR